MKTITQIKAAAMTLALASLALTGCKKESLPNDGASNSATASSQRIAPMPHLKGMISIKLMSRERSLYEEVNVQISGLVIHYADRAGYLKVPINSSIVDLRQVSRIGGIWLASNFSIPVGKIDQISLLLGTSNSVVVGDDEHRAVFPLIISDNARVINMTALNPVIPGQVSVLSIDFNSGASVEKLKTGYALKPTATLDDYIP